jgi:hypothetical protein
MESLLKTVKRPILSVLLEEKLQPSKKPEVVDEIVKKLYDQKHPLRNNLFYMDCVPEVKAVFDILSIPKDFRSKVTGSIKDCDSAMGRVDSIVESVAKRTEYPDNLNFDKVDYD